MALVFAAKPGLSTDMNQTTQQEQVADPAKPRARRHWEWFWRVIAGLMLLIIAWVAWVLYQITPRSVVTPLAYANQIRPIVAQPPAAGATTPAAAAAAATADLAMGIAQAAARAGAHQSSADVQAAAWAKKDGQVKGEGLRLATEISKPPVENQGIAQTPVGQAGGAVPAATGAAGKDRP